MTAEGSDEPGTRSVERALALLAAVCDGGALSLVEASRASGLSPSTATRLLRTMTKIGFVRRTEANEYLPGVRLMQLGARVLSTDSLIKLCQPVMNSLAVSTGESVYLSMRGVGGSATYVAIAEGTHSVRHVSWVGRSFDIESSAAGQLLLGGSDLAGYRVVQQAIEPDVTAIAAPLRSDDRVLAALSLLVPSYRAEAEDVSRLGQELAGQAQRLSGHLGSE